MDLLEKVRQLPTTAGVYLYRNAEGVVIYVGKAKNLRARVRSYFLQASTADAKTGTLIREAVDLDFILVDNEREALALENNLIKQHLPRFNVLLRDDKTYPYIKLTRETYPRIYVTRRLRPDGAEYFGPYFPAHLAYRIAHFIHKRFLVPSCWVDLTRNHARPCLQFHIHRCLGPCVSGLTSAAVYGEAVKDVRLFLAGRHHDLVRNLEARRDLAAAKERYEQAAALRDLLTTVADLAERQKMDSAQQDDADIIGFHREGERAALNLFHLRRGRIVDRREFFWENLPALGAPAGDEAAGDEVLGNVLKQIYLSGPPGHPGYVPPRILLPAEFEDREPLEELLRERRGGAVAILTPQRGAKKALLELAQRNAAQSFEQRFRVLKPSARSIAEGLQDALGLEATPERIECFDISHFQGAETVASLVVWEKGRMKKSDYRKFLIKGVTGIDDFRSMEEVVTRRYRALLESKQPFPSLILVDGGLGQLHAAQRALELLQVVNQPLASIAKREEIIYVAGQEAEPVVLDHHSPVLHLVQMIRDESHRFAITFHRRRRETKELRSGLLEVPGIGETTARKLLQHFGSLDAVGRAGVEELGAVLNRRQRVTLWEHLHKTPEPSR